MLLENSDGSIDSRYKYDLISDSVSLKELYGFLVERQSGILQYPSAIVVLETLSTIPFYEDFSMVPDERFADTDGDS